MIAQFTTPSDSSPEKKPADAWPALVALSMRRTLRKLYDGPWFRWRAGQEEGDYPERNPPTTLDGIYHVVKIYDQKAFYGHPAYDAVQLDHSLQPKLLQDDNGYYAYFELGQYMDLEGSPGESVGRDFTITAIGDGSHPRPMVGIFGDNDQVTVEPGRKTNRFSFNDSFGSISKNSGDLVNQLFSGIDPSQNNNRVLTMKSDGGGSGQNLTTDSSARFHTISVGRSKNRFFSGSFIEATVHLSGLTRVASDQLWEDAKSVY